MDNIRDIFAKNLRESRRKNGFTQAQLAEMAGVSTHYVALIELARNIPKIDTMERLAKALQVEIYELLFVPTSPAIETQKLKESIITELKDIVKRSVNEAFEEERSKQKKL